MHTKNHRRWHLLISQHGYRPGCDPLDLLDVLLTCVGQDRGALLRAVIDDTRDILVMLALGDGSDGAGDNPLCEPELVAAIETLTLVFASRLAGGRVPRWLLHDTYLGLRMRRLARQLWQPQADGSAAAARAILDERGAIIDGEIAQFVAAIDAGAWPEASICRRLANALVEVPPRTPRAARAWMLESAELLGTLADEGLAGSQLRYMAAVTERGRVQTVGHSSGIRGALENVADDVARPLLRMSRTALVRPPREIRSRLSRARDKVVSRWMYRGRPRWSSDRIARLEHVLELARLGG